MYCQMQPAPRETDVKRARALARRAVAAANELDQAHATECSSTSQERLRAVLEAIPGKRIGPRVS
jgi:hypothetical protein